MAKGDPSFGKAVANGILNENPTFRLVLGMCPTLAVTTMAINGISMGLATMVVLVFSNLFVSLMRKVIPSNVRIPAMVIIIAAFVTIVQLFIKAYLPSIDETLGIYIPLIVVNCIIFGRAEAFALKQGPVASIADGIGMGLGFTLAITVLASIREVMGNGTFFGMQVFSDSFEPMLIMGRAPGGFILLGLLLALVNFVTRSNKSGQADEVIAEEGME